MIESFKVQKVSGRDFLIKVEFSDPIQISSDSTSPDFLFISLDFRFLFVTQKGLVLSTEPHEDLKENPLQMPKEDAIFLQSVGTAFAATSQMLVFGTLALNIFMATSL